jgi:hypothetical protein
MIAETTMPVVKKYSARSNYVVARKQKAAAIVRNSGEEPRASRSVELGKAFKAQARELSMVRSQLAELQERMIVLEGMSPTIEVDEHEEAFERAASKATDHLSVRPPAPSKKLTMKDLLAASDREEVRVRESLERMAAEQRRGKK